MNRIADALFAADDVRISVELRSDASHWTVSHAAPSEAMNEPYRAMLHLTSSEFGCIVRVVPALALLEHRRDTRIFQDQSVPEILKTVFAALSDYDGEFAVDTSKSHPKSEYRTQYDETDLQFVLRLIGDSGLSRHDSNALLSDAEVRRYLIAHGATWIQTRATNPSPSP